MPEIERQRRGRSRRRKEEEEDIFFLFSPPPPFLDDELIPRLAAAVGACLARDSPQFFFVILPQVRHAEAVSCPSKRADREKAERHAIASWEKHLQKSLMLATGKLSFLYIVKYGRTKHASLHFICSLGFVDPPPRHLPADCGPLHLHHGPQVRGIPLAAHR